ncbi:Cation efflux system protein CzcB [Roseibium album]|nr:Cation efflux system protein CzcB [Roseibium album]
MMLRIWVPVSTLLAIVFLIKPLSAQELSERVFDCVMDPAETVRVGSPFSGLLDSVEVRRGDRVEKGQVVARLNSSIARSTYDLLKTRASSSASIEAQEARYKLAVKRHARIKELLARKVASQTAMDEIEAELVASRSLVSRAELEYAVAAKELKRAKADLDLREIKSPIDGLVVERNLTGGEFVSQDDYVISIIKLDPLYVETFLPVVLYNQVQLGARAKVSPAPPVIGTYEAKVIVVDQMFDLASGTFGVRLELPNSNDRLPAGHRCQLVFESTAG